MPEAGSETATTVPGELFDRLLATEDLSELKAVLVVLRLATTQGTASVLAADLWAPEHARAIAGPFNPEGAEKRVQRAVERAVTNGLLMRVTAGNGSDRRQYLIPATDRAAELAQQLRAEAPQAAEELGIPADENLAVYRPNVFALYERHLGPLTPVVADQLRDAERAYPRVWIEEAILAAAESNARSWRYIETVLSHWEESGRPAGRRGEPSR